MFSTNQDQKIRVDIITPQRVISRKFPTEGNKVILRKGQKGRGGVEYAPTYNKDSILDYKKGFWIFSRTEKKLMIMNGADNFITFKQDGKKGTVEIPTWDRKSINNLFKADVIKNAGNLSSSFKIPAFLYGISGVTLALVFLVLLLVSGRVSI